MDIAKQKFAARHKKEREQLLASYGEDRYKKKRNNLSRVENLKELITRGESECPDVLYGTESFSEIVLSEMELLRTTIREIKKDSSTVNVHTGIKSLIKAFLLSKFERKSRRDTDIVLSKMTAEEKHWDRCKAVRKNANGMIVQNFKPAFPTFARSANVDNQRAFDYVMEACDSDGKDPDFCSPEIQTWLTMMMLFQKALNDWPELLMVKNVREKSYYDFPYVPLELWPWEEKTRTWFVELELHIAGITFSSIWLELDLLVSHSPYRTQVEKAFKTLVIEREIQEIQQSKSLTELENRYPSFQELNNISAS